MADNDDIFGKLKGALSKRTEGCVVERHIPGLLAGNLAPEDEDKLRSHMAFCWRCRNKYYRRRRFGLLWSELREGAGAGAAGAVDQVASLLRDRDWAESGSAAASADRPDDGAEYAERLVAELLDSQYDLTGDTVSAAIAEAPHIAEDGILSARFVIPDAQCVGRILSLSVLVGAGRQLTATAGLRRLKAGPDADCEAVFKEEGFARDPVDIPLDRVKLYLWDPDATPLDD